MAAKFYFRDSLNSEYENNPIRSRYGEAYNTGKIPEYRFVLILLNLCFILANLSMNEKIQKQLEFFSRLLR